MSEKKYMSYESQSHYDNRIKQYIENKMQVLSEKSDTVKSIKGSVPCATDAAKAPIQGLKLFGRTTQNGTPTPDAPVPLVSAGDGGSLGVTVAGKNLFGGVYNVRYSLLIPANTPFTASTDVGSANTYFYAFRKDGTTLTYGSILNDITVGGTARKHRTWTLTEDVYAVSFQTAETGRYQIEIGSTATAYEPYTEQSLTISAPNGLPGIPVTSGGNYTDETGQQWVCDEVDFGRGVYVQRVDKLSLKVADMNNSETHPGWNNVEKLRSAYPGYLGYLKNTCSFVSNVTKYEQYAFSVNTASNNRILFLPNNDYWKKTQSEWIANYSNLTFEILFSIPPIETPLSADELADYAALHTNYPNTTILNDGGAGMEVKYCTPITSVSMVHGEADVGKFLAIDEHGCVTKVMPDEDLDSKSSNLVQNKVVSEAISVLNTELSEHTHNYAGSSSPGGAATSADKLNTDNGSSIQPVYFSNGVPVATTYTLRANVPSNAKFTDTTYSAATSSSAGLMSANDKSKLDAISESADTVSFSQNATSGNKVGTITINGVETEMYSPAQTTITGNAGTATTLKTARYIDGVSFTGSANVTRYATCSTSAGTTAKTASITAGTFSLITGARVTVKFTYANTASSPTLNVGNTGAKSIYWRGAALASTQYWAAGAVLDFVYNGTQWELVGVANDTSGSYTHPSYTAITGVPTANASPAFGGTFSVSQPVSDSAGHITAINSRTITIPNTTASTSTNGLMTTAMVTKLNGIATGATANTVSAKTVTLSTSSWSSLSQTVSVSGVTTSNNVVVTPAPTSLAAYSSAGVYCSAQNSGKLTFTCTELPTESLTVNILILA